ncbi:hypothetical protein AALP_AA8G499800 [Arabis alpina]|uniref:Reverse transcriptase n=1 Tax=Arabis alpina TaxID=50452 RepID=A0A087GEK8_ARAAL|nr:hypothetical protein AALP_AA8G499800 [Arabis alpina]
MESPSTNAATAGSEKSELEMSVSELKAQMKEVLELLKHQRPSLSPFPVPNTAGPSVLQREGKGISFESPSQYTDTNRDIGYSPPIPQQWGRPDYNHTPFTRRLELPTFNGEQPESWISRVEQYFEIEDLADHQKLNAVRACFVDRALDWYRWERDRHPFRSWPDPRLRIVAQYASDNNSCAGKRLLVLKQDGAVADFCRDFIGLATNAPEVPEFILEWTFMNGLKPHIRSRVQTFEPQTLEKMMSVAKLVDGWSESAFGSSVASYFPTSKTARDGPTRGLGFSNNTGPTSTTGLALNKPNSQLTPSDNTQSFSQTEKRNPTTHNRVKPPYRRLTPIEMAQRKADGLCFRCDEKWHIRHQCPKKEVNVLLVQEDGPDILWEADDDFTDATDQAITELAELSLNSMVGISSPSTMKLMGTIQTTEVVVLIDSGASHNFVSEQLVHRLGLQSAKTGSYGVLTGGGMTVRGAGVCRGLVLLLQGLRIRDDFLPLELGSADVILGIKWLSSLGEMKVNWGRQYMRFSLGGETAVLQGDPGQGCSAISLKSLMRAVKDQGVGLLVEYNGLQSLDQVAGFTTEVPQALVSVMDQFPQVFEDPQGLPPTRGRAHEINLESGAKAVSVRPFRYPQTQKAEIEKQVTAMLAAGIIQESTSTFSSPVLLVKKKDGSWRFCIDYRALNKVTIPDSFPIPMIDQLLDELHGATVFSKLDLKSGYHQILVKPQNVPKTAFRTHDGHYEFLVMPFGLTNAPTTFQALMNEVFRAHLRKFVLVFFDDILVYSSSLQEHQEHLRVVLQILFQQQLFANKKKCQFGSSSIEYLGHVISGEGVSADPSKLQAMVSWPLPKNIKALRGFLGLTGYYRRFVQGYGSIAKPLTSLLKKDKFQWSEEATVAFEKLKVAMSTVPVLALVDFSELFVVESDASGIGLGAVLLQKQKPVAYFSQALTDRQKLKSVYERELMAIVFAIQKWRHYLLGRKFLVRTDQKSLKFLLEQREVNLEYQQWLTKILGFNFDIHYKPGLENKAADALSRVEGLPQLYALSVPAAIQLEEINEEVDRNPVSKKIKEEVLLDASTHSGYSVVQGRLLYNGKLVLPKESYLIKVLLHEFHNSRMGGHGGVLKTQRHLGALFYWQGMMADIKTFVAECVVCQKHKYSTLAPSGLLQPLPIPTQVWEDISLDFVEGLPKSEGFDAILVVVDRLTKYAHFIKLQHPFGAKEIAAVFIQEIVRLHGYPSTMVSDRDTLFTGMFWTELFRLAGTSLNFSTAYHPQTDGQTEVTNRGLETILRCFTSDKPKKWAAYLPWAEFCYNSSYHSAIQMTPFKALYGRDPPSLLRFEDGSTTNANLETQLKERDAMIVILKQNILKAQQLMKHRADGHRREVEFKVGDMVFLKLKPYRQQSLARRVNEKLAARFYGPYEVLARVGVVAYQLKLPADSKIHDTFHVSQLKLAVGSSFQPAALPPHLTAENVLEAEPEAHMGVRINSRSGQQEVLIKWKGLPECDSTWEWVGVIQEQFPEFDLEDKALFKAAGIVTEISEKTPLVHQYRRRKKFGKQGRSASGPDLG